jgi:hypothetical protein
MMKLKPKQLLLDATALLTFFPFFKIIPITAEIQPIGAAIAIIYIFAFDLRSRKRRAMYSSGTPFLAVFFSYLATALYFYANGANLDLSFIIQSIAIFLAPLSVFFVMLGRMTSIPVGIFRFSLYSWFVVSFLQALAPGLLRATGIATLLSNSIARFASETVGVGRGIAAFSPEPSYAAHIILLMGGVLFLFFKKKIILQKEFTVMLIMILFMVVVNQSGTIGFFTAVFGLSYGIWELFKGGTRTLKILMTFMVIACGGVLASFIFPQILEARFFFVLSKLLDSLFSPESQGFSAVEFSDQFGSVRASAVQVGYESLSITNGWGLGLGGWGTYSVELAKKTKVAEVSQYLFSYGDTPIRPYAYASFVALDLGILGLGSLSYLFGKKLYDYISSVGNITSFSFACFWVFFIGVYYNQPTSLVAHWLFLNMMLEDK